MISSSGGNMAGWFRAVTLVCSLALASAFAQTNTAQRLGYPADTKLLIVHADDLAVSHSQDRASFAALERHAASAASIMVPCPWLTEVAEYAKSHPDADLGLHLTLTSEWQNYRWGPVASRDEVPGLLGPDGNLWPDVPFVAKHATAAEVEKEIRAQIELALKVGIRPTHLDSHMATLFNPAYFPVYVKVAHEYGLPFLAARPPNAPASMLALLKDTDILPDAIAIAAVVKPENWASYYLGIVRALKPGLTELIVHLAYDDAEMQGITEGHPDYGSAWRQRDFDVITGAEFRKALKDNHVTLVGWRAIKGGAKQ
jgi:chitin disaccharide deacetylase